MPSFETLRGRTGSYDRGRVPDLVARSASDKGGPFRAMRSRNFAILWVGNLLSNTGTWMQQVAEPWLVLRLSGSPFLLGLDSFVTDAPLWLLILAGGVIADRRDKRRTALFFQGIQVLCPVLLVALLATGHIRVWMVIALSLVVGITDALSGPSINALVPSLVPEDDVPSAVALKSAQFNLSRVLGARAARPSSEQRAGAICACVTVPASPLAGPFPETSGLDPEGACGRLQSSTF